MLRQVDIVFDRSRSTVISKIVLWTLAFFGHPDVSLGRPLPDRLPASSQVSPMCPGWTLHDRVIAVTRFGRICLGKEKINFSTVFAGQAVGIKKVHDDIWLVSFMNYDLGYFDLETRVLEPLENPFGPIVLPM